MWKALTLPSQHLAVNFLTRTSQWGPYDAVAKVDFPDDKSLAAFALALAATGNQETVTMSAYGLDDVKEIVAKSPN
jgi:uncharacterized protein with GYD domain